MPVWLSRNLFNFGVASFFNDFSHEMVTALLPTVISALVGPELTPSVLGIIEGVADIASMGMKLLSGWLADHIKSYKPILLVGYATTPLFLALLGTTESVLLILVYRTIAWMGRGLREPVRDTWIANITRSQFYGRAYGFHRAADTLGAICGPLAVVLLLHQHIPYRMVGLYALIPGILSVLAVGFLREDIHMPRGTHKAWWASFTQFPPQFISFVITMGVFGLGNFHQVLLVYRVQSVMPDNGPFWGVAFYTFFNVVRALAEFGIGYLSDFVRRPYLLAVFGFGLFGVTALGCMYEGNSLLVWLVLFVGAGVSVGTVRTLERAHAATLLPEAVRGTGLGLLQAVDGAGDLISSSVVGILWSSFSPAIGLSYSALLSGFAALLLLRRG